MKIENFTEIDSWIEARKLVNKIYEMTKKEKFKKDYGLKDQIQRAGVSIMSNISEGFDSGSNKIFINFLNYSYRSASEVESLLYVAADLRYINENEFKELKKDVNKTKKFDRWIHSIFEELNCTTEFVEKQQRTPNKEQNNYSPR